MRHRSNPRLARQAETPDFRPRKKGPGASVRISWLKTKAADYTHVEQRLWNRLLEVGGDAVASVYEDRAIELIQRGKLFYGRVRMRLGEERECHWNSCVEWRKDPKLTLCTGWGLNWDEDGVGCWRQHSFLLDPRKGLLIETTLARHAYFGMELTDSEAEDFSDDNDVFGVP